MVNTRTIWIMWTYIANYSENPIELTVPEGTTNLGAFACQQFRGYDQKFLDKARVHIFGDIGHIWSGDLKDLRESSGLS